MKFKFIKKGDAIIIAAVILACIILLIPKFINKTDVEAVIYVDGSEYMRTSLDEDKTITPDTQIQTVIKVHDGEIYFESSECPDKVCVKTGKLKRAGDTAACLPAKVVITLVGDKKTHDAITG